MKHKSYVRHLSAGTYRFLPFSHYSIIIADMRHPFKPQGLDIELFLADSTLLALLHVVIVRDHEIALHYVDGNFARILPPGKHAFFKAIYTHTFVLVDTNDPFIPATVDSAIFGKAYFRSEGAAYVHRFTVPAGNVGVLLRNGAPVMNVPSGNHYFWKGRDALEVVMVDQRTCLLEINGQELLSEDKVTLRMNLVCQYRIVDVVKVATDFERHQEQLYITLQLALREYVSTKRLDELLAEKHEIGRIIRAAVAEKQDSLGLVFLEAGVKDIILPGDVRDILNTVLVAEKKALANVITRREETASTRSLLNTARLMEENQTLYKLKELEYLERICDKVGSISLSAGSGIIEQLGALLGK